MLTMLLGLALASEPAHGDDTDHHDAHNLVLLRVESVVYGDANGAHPSGAGLAWAHHLGRQRLELETGVVTLFARHHVSMEFDLRLDVPMPVGPRVDLHLGMGPVMTFRWQEGQRPSVHPGGVAGADVIGWANEHVGVVTSVSSVVTIERRAAVLEIEAGVGAAFRI